MDLSTIAKIQKKTTSMAQQRHDVAANLISRGFAALQAAQQEDFANRGRLVEAAELLTEAIRHQRSNPDPYVGLGYILWLVGEYQESIAYLQEALVFDPDNQDAHDLLDRMSQSRPTVSSALPVYIQAKSAFDDEEEPDYDALYDQVESLITQIVQQVSSLGPTAFTISDERFVIEKMERKYKGFVQTHQDILERIEFVEAEIDCDDLRTRLRPLNVFLDRCRQTLAKSWQLVELEQVLNGHITWMKDELARCDAAGPSWADNFNQQRFDCLLGDCDALADQLDLFEQEGQNITGLIQIYEHLAGYVSAMQDLLDQY